jgi:polysaccharide deacetylase 2 family uncharacterized protein YibQ
VVAELTRQGAEILCHLPMEAGNGADPGPGALRTGMSRKELIAATEAALAPVPSAVGVNNHMGSLFSSDAAAMRPVLEVLARRGLFFLDSRTSGDSVGYSLAQSLGVPATNRNVFLDGQPDAESIRAEFERLLELAAQQGSAVAIGHPYPVTIATLAGEVPRARALGYRFVPVSHLLDRVAPPLE